MGKVEIKGDYLYFDRNDCKKGKIYASKFGAYSGYDDWNKAGDMLLKALKLVNDEPFNEFYSARGEYAERILTQRLSKIGATYDYLGRTESGKVFDIFDFNPVFGGVPDVYLRTKNGKVVLECKSKNIKDYDKMSKGADKNHIAQAQLYAFLSGCTKFSIVYVFFTNEQEAIIKNKMKETDDFINCGDLFPFNYEEQTIRHNFVVKEDIVKQDMQNSYDFVEKCWNEQRIPLNTISDKTLEKMGLLEQKPFDIFATMGK